MRLHGLTLIDSDAAYKVAFPGDYTAAEVNVRNVRRGLREAREEGLSHISRDDRSNINNSTHVPWISRLTESTKPHWGLVCFRTAFDDEDAWQRYKQYLIRWSSVGISARHGTDYVASKWKIEFIEDDRESLEGANVEQLCR